MKNNLIITISREYGSGGREIGEKLAMELGIPFYDKAIIDKAAKETGFCAEFIEKEEQRVTSSLLFNLATNTYTFGNMVSHYGQSLSDQVFQAEAKIIKDLANEGSCVIVGRCADYILKNQFPCFNIFVCADFEKRCERAIKIDDIAKEDVNDVVKKKDKARIRHNQFYGSQDWGDARNYDITVNSGTLGIDNTVQILKAAIENYK
ncbi:MAG: cytidylate kinase-like family protein [Ruminococcaceae bacterium]|nr:cytidylate kinase-like family protein [Oscillospiraceae bacterium]